MSGLPPSSSGSKRYRQQGLSISSSRRRSNSMEYYGNVMMIISGTDQPEMLCVDSS